MANMTICRSSYSNSKLTLVLVALVLYVLIAPSWANLDASKQELQLRDLESKVESDRDQLNENTPVSARARTSGLFSSRRNQRSIYGLGPRMLQISRSKIPIELDLLVDNDAAGERPKRFDDYGHMRFGKRGGDDQFDDYGHMRFGRKK
ncbi:drosulfakinins [Scaptodrosophila lebanonensis]|uniref:Drosulfakinins n=1 Tax=Drosophila lebanonensis TaxID=7225 RepID=A0A6J2T295_DROLE|nr:drosulfakinins [Scaptodrosophila lebanonensis]